MAYLSPRFREIIYKYTAACLAFSSGSSPTPSIPALPSSTNDVPGLEVLNHDGEWMESYAADEGNFGGLIYRGGFCGDGMADNAYGRFVIRMGRERYSVLYCFWDDWGRGCGL